MGLIEAIKEYFIKKEANKIMANAFIQKLIGLFLGDESKKRYLIALWLAYQAVAPVFHLPLLTGIFDPMNPHGVFAPFALWAASDAVKKLEKK